MAPVDVELPRVLGKGENVGLRELDAELGSVSVQLETGGRDGERIDADVSVILLGRDGVVRSNDDLVFYNQPTALAGAVHLRDKIRPDDDGTVSIDVVTLELDDVPEDVDRILIGASLEPAAGVRFGEAGHIRMTLHRSSDADALVVFTVDDATTELALVVGEFYRRAEVWRFRAIGQGYEGGLATLIADFGVDVDPPEADPARADPADDTPAVVASSPVTGAAATPAPVEAPDTEADATGSSRSAPAETAGAADVPGVLLPVPVEPDLGVGAEGELRAPRVSVRRSTSPPRMPVDWDATVPAGGEEDWQPARLFPVAGIGVGEEQERRATSALLAVMSTVREFGRALITAFGAPVGPIETFVEVPFGHGEQAYRPDGVIRVTRGGKTWTALVEVKTSDARLAQAQVDTYVDIARAHDYDAVITISNQLAGSPDDSPVLIDRRKLRKVTLHHLSWDQIRTEAVLLVEHWGVADPTQRRVVEEFIRYMRHPRSGLQGFTDMGMGWVKVRDGVKTRTLQVTDRATVDVSGAFDQLVCHLGLHLSGLLGVNVAAVRPRTGTDSVTRCQQLADSGVLFGSLQVPGAVDRLVLTADLRAERVSCSVTVDGPRQGRPLTGVTWLLRQVTDARDAVRVEALLAGGRGQSTVALLGSLRKTPQALLPKDGREIRAFRLILDMPMGAKRGVGKGSLIGSVTTVTDCFYAEVVQHLRPWSARPPQMPAATD